MLEDLFDESTYPEEWQQLRREEAELTNRYTELQDEQHGIERLRRQYHRWQQPSGTTGTIPPYVDQGDIRYFERTQGPRLIELEREMAHIDQRLEQIRARLDTLGEGITRSYMESGGHPRREESKGKFKRRRFHAPGHFGADPRIYNEHGEPTEIDSFTGKPIPLDLNLPSSRITPDARHLGLQLYDALMVQIHSNPMLSADAMRILKPWEQTNFEQAWESVNEPEFPEKLASGPSDLWGKDLWRVLAVVNDVQRVMGKPPLFPPEAVARLASGLHGGPGSVPTFRNIQQAQLTGAVNNPQKRDPEDWALERMSRPQAGGHYGGKKIKFHNEHGKKVSVSVVAIPETAGATVRMTLQGPHSTMVNDITLMEARYLHKALSEFLQGNTEFAARAPHR